MLLAPLTLLAILSVHNAVTEVQDPLRSQALGENDLKTGRHILCVLRAQQKRLSVCCVFGSCTYFYALGHLRY